MIGKHHGREGDGADPFDLDDTDALQGTGHIVLRKLQLDQIFSRSTWEEGSVVVMCRPMMSFMISELPPNILLGNHHIIEGKFGRVLTDQSCIFAN